MVAHEHTWSYEGRPVRKLLDRWVVAAGCDAFVAKPFDLDHLVAVLHECRRGGRGEGA